jgi:hypothetical protein
MEKSREQRLIDMCFSIGLVIGETKLKTNEEKANWIAEQLKANGFETVPCGMSWGILKDS